MLAKKLKLNALSEMILKDKEMCSILGGDRFCTCSCAYQGTPGGSSSVNNKEANYELGPEGGYSTSGCNAYIMGWPW